MKTLEDLPEGARFKIIDFDGCGVEMKINNLTNPEKILTVSTKHPFKGPITLRNDNHEFAIGRGMARKIYVEEYNVEKKNAEENGGKYKR